MRFIAALDWILGFALLTYLARSWSRLPDRVAIHFGFDGRPDNWGSKRIFGGLIIGVVLVELMTVTSASVYGPAGVGFPFTAALATTLLPPVLLWRAIKSNVNGDRIHPLWIWIPLGMVLLTTIAAAVQPHWAR